jgi:hypothetical protein
VGQLREHPQYSFPDKIPEWAGAYRPKMKRNFLFVSAAFFEIGQSILLDYFHIMELD